MLTEFRTHIRREIMRMFSVATITLVPPLISILLFMLIFGYVLGGRITTDTPYLLFIAPGLILMNIITGAYMNPSGSIFIAKWNGFIEDLLVSPLRYIEMATGYYIGGIIRGLLLGLGAWAIASFFQPLPILFPLHFLILFLAISIIFASIGIIIGLLASTWENLNIFPTFILTPLVFLGGVFYSINTLPPLLKTITAYNPVYYLVDATRYCFTGTAETNITLTLALLIPSAILCVLLITYLFSKGWKLRT